MSFMTVYLNFNGDAEEAFGYYRTVFGREFSGVLRFRDFGPDAMGASGDDLDKIAHVSLPIAGEIGLMGSDVIGRDAEEFRAGNNYHIYFEADSAEEAERVFSALSDGGVQEMPLQAVEWAEKYGSCVDRFGVQWMVSYTGAVEFSL